MNMNFGDGAAARSIAGRLRRAVLLATACAIALNAAVSAPAAAQAFPNKPIRLVVAYPAGGSIDLAGRRLAEDLAVELGQSVIVDNRPGANGIIGSEAVARAAPDGYTLLLTTVPAHAGNPAAYKKLPYDSIKDFSPITILNSVPLVLVAHPSFPAKNVADLIRMAKERPGQISYASFGTGGMAHLAGVQMNIIGGTEMVHVPYKGGGPALADLLGNHVNLFFSGVNTALPHIKAGRLHAIALSGNVRSKSLPDVPTVAETPGFKSYEASVSPIVLAPAKTPPEVVNRLHAAIVKVTHTPQYRAKLERDGEGDPIESTPKETTATLANEIERFAKLFKVAGIVPE
jgi:tripartite-type tricarboxylate transporter receptor subunit TctC